MSTSNTVVEQC